MDATGKFLRRPPAERRLLLTAALLLLWVRLGLLTLRFGTLRGQLARLARTSRRFQLSAKLPVERISWAVSRAGRWIPGGQWCLPQALVCQVLLVRHGHPGTLRIGVARGDGAGVRAHAWVESEGAIVIGRRESIRFVPLHTSQGDTDWADRAGA